jgi:uncharacterized protein (TIGR03086 family)
MDDLEKFLTAQRAFTARVHAVTEDQWHLSTPDNDWSVADLVSHLIDEHRWAGPLLHGLDLESAAKVVEGSRTLPVDGGVGANLAEVWDEAAVESADAFAADGALDRTVELSRGATPARDYVAEMTFDLIVHGWDLGKAIGHPDPLPADVVEELYQANRGGDMSSSGLFEPPVDVPDAAPTIDKLVAGTGRDPHWSR